MNFFILVQIILINFLSYVTSTLILFSRCFFKQQHDVQFIFAKNNKLKCCCYLFCQPTPIHSVASGVGAVEGVVTEIIITFGLVYTVYATAADPKKGSLGIIAPIAIGFIVGANILAAGPFSGGSMNPARSFGPAVVSGDFHDNWIYWVGPLIGGGLAGLIYGNVFIRSDHAPLSSEF